MGTWVEQNRVRCNTPKPFLNPLEEEGKEIARIQVINRVIEACMWLETYYTNNFSAKFEALEWFQLAIEVRFELSLENLLDFLLHQKGIGFGNLFE